MYGLSAGGFFSGGAGGFIKEGNLTGAEMLGVSKRLLLDKPFLLFVVRDDAAVYQAHRRDVLKMQIRQICELRMTPRNTQEFYARIQSTAGANGDDKAGQIRTAVIDITKRKRAEEEREKLIGELEASLSKIKTLTGLLPICASCKKIRDDGGYWQQVEQYISDHTNVLFSHGMCPECYTKEKEYLKKRNRNDSTVTS